MLWLLIACTASDSGKDSGLDSTVDTQDSGQIGFFPLEETPYWESFESGVATGLAWADIDKDGFAELIVSYGNDVQRGPLTLYDNIGGILDTHTLWQSETRAFYGHLDVGDINGDGWTDVVVSRFLGDNGFPDPGGIEVFINQEGSLPDTPSWMSSESFYSFSNALGDLDGDGDLDLAVAVGEPYYNAPAASLVYLNDGTGDFGTPVWESGTLQHSMDVSWADFDADGDLDLVFANQGSPHTLYTNEEGQLATVPSWEASGDSFEGNSIDWGDVNSDGHIDLVISDNQQLGGPGVVSLFCGPTLDLCWQSQDDPAQQSALSLHDADNDGDLDLTAGSWWGQVRMYENLSGSLSESAGWHSSGSSVIEAFAWEDIDRSHAVEKSLLGTGLVAIPNRSRVLSIVGGVSAGGWASGPGEMEITYLESTASELAVSNWDREIGNHIYSPTP